MMDDLKDQLLIVFLKRLGGRVECSVREVDNTADDLLAFSLIEGRFVFELHKKQ